MFIFLLIPLQSLFPSFVLFSVHVISTDNITEVNAHNHIYVHGVIINSCRECMCVYIVAW